MPEEDTQLRIAVEALNRIFRGRFRLVEVEGQLHSEVAGFLDAAGVEESRAFLSERTGLGLDINPFERADGTAWIIVSNILSQVQQRALALDFALSYLGVCYRLQLEAEERIRKGAPHFWISLRHEEIGDEEAAQAHMILAFIEDVKDQENPRAAPAYGHLTGRLGVFSKELEALEQYAEAFLDSFPLFPEEILLKFQLAIEPEMGTSIRFGE